MASAKAGDETSLLRAISAVYRPAALFLTNKENFAVSDGDYADTQINSSNMLWSLSGNIALVYKVLFGIHYTGSSLDFKPFVPKALAGARSLSNYKYRNAILDITMTGFGNQVKNMWIDGKRQLNFSIPATLQGKHTVKIILANNILTGQSNLAPDYTAPETPVVTYHSGKLTWPQIASAVSYNVTRNGKSLISVKTTTYKVAPNNYAEYQVAAIDAHGVSSFKSEPLPVIPAGTENITEAETIADRADLPYAGFSGSGFVEISKTKNTTLTIPVTVKQDGLYAIDFQYANGNGPINTENKCAIRTLDIDKHFAGTVVFPQRGKGEWSTWGFTNPLKVKLLKGAHTITLQFKDANENMNRVINQAMVDYLRVIKIGG